MGSLISSTNVSAPALNLVENLRPAQMSKVGSYGSQTLLKQDKLGMLAEKLDQFIDKTNKTLGKISERLDSVEEMLQIQ